MYKRLIAQVFGLFMASVAMETGSRADTLMASPQTAAPVVGTVAEGRVYEVAGRPGFGKRAVSPKGKKTVEPAKPKKKIGVSKVRGNTKGTTKKGRKVYKPKKPSLTSKEKAAAQRKLDKLRGSKLDKKTEATFAGGKYKNRKLKKDTLLYKYHGVDNRTGRKISWLTNKKYKSEIGLRKDLAIRKAWGVNITHVTSFRIPKGTWISEGRAASQGQRYPGGGYQVVIRDLPKSWSIGTERAFSK